MSNNRKDMKQIYMIRRIVALLVIVLVLVLIFTQCISKGKDNKKTTTNTTTNNQNAQVVTVQPDKEPEVKAPETDTENSGDQLQVALKSNEDKLNDEYGTRADVSYDNSTNRFYFKLKDDAKNIVVDRKTDETFKKFWESLVYDLTKTSETLAESVQPGIELHVVDPSDDKSTLLVIKDGSTVFDATSSN